jgi:D-alanine--D-alanine ligase
LDVIIFFGGRSSERDVSLGSIKPWVTYLQADDQVGRLSVVFLDREFEPYLLSARYYYANTCADFESQIRDTDAALSWEDVENLAQQHDVVVPLVHGEFGEDGQLQALIESWRCPYVFSTPEALRISLDKAACYERLASSGFPIPVHVQVTIDEWRRNEAAVLQQVLDLDKTTGFGNKDLVAVKPLRSGSSFGVSIAERSDAEEIVRALVRAFDESDGAVLLEEFISGIEFSVVVLDGPAGAPVALAPTEIEKPHGSLVYGTKEKYLHGAGAVHHTPIRKDSETIDLIRGKAAAAYRALGLRHMARVDGFLTAEGMVVVTDVNGIGGMGFSSFVFQQAAMVGLDHRSLIFGLIAVALGDRVSVVVPSSSTVAPGTRVHVVLGGPTSERQVSRQSGCFVGLSLVACGYDVRFVLMDLQCRFTEIGLFYVLHHDVEEIQRLIGDPVLRDRIRSLALRIVADFAVPADVVDRHLSVGQTSDLGAAVEDAEFVFLALHGGPGEDGTIQAALEVLNRPYNGSGIEASALASNKSATANVVRTLDLNGVSSPRQFRLSTLEMAEWLKEDEASWGARFTTIANELGSTDIVCKPESDGCSTGVKIIPDPLVLRNYLRAIVTCSSSFRTGDRRPDLRSEEFVVQLPIPPPKTWILEQALIESPRIPLPKGDLNLENVKSWFDRKAYVELTCGILDLPNGGLVAAVPSVTVAAQELTLQQKFEQGVGTNLALDLFVDAPTVASIRERVLKLADVLQIEGYGRLDLFWNKEFDLLYLLEVNTLCGLTEATVFYGQWLMAEPSMPPWVVLKRIVDAGFERRAETVGALHAK